LCLSIFVAGCGLADYEQDMLLAQKRVARADEEARALEETPLQTPTKKVAADSAQPTPPVPAQVAASQTGSAKLASGIPAEKVTVPVADVFLRLPRGCAPRAVEPARDDFIFQFPGPKTGPVLDVYVAFGAADMKDFNAKVMTYFPRNPNPAPRQVMRTIKTHPDRGRDLVFDSIEFEDVNAFYSANFLAGKTPTAVIFRLDKYQQSKLLAPGGVVDLSLSTLALDAEAEAVRRSYSHRPRPVTR
jgi:hypothetical protein